MPPAFTLFIPTYNRAEVLPRTLESVEAQTLRDFEVLVVDDGSTDNTPAVVERWAAHQTIPTRYFRQQNQGKHAAHNFAVSQAQGRFFMTLDAGDKILPDALEKVLAHWNAIPAEQQPAFAGVSGLCLNEDGTVSGDPYPRDVIDSDYIEIFRHCRMNGERREALRTEVLREFPYPRIEGERHVRPTLILRRMAHRYKLRFVNTLLQVNVHERDGITANRFRYRMRNPKGLRLYYLEEITLNDRATPRAKLRRQHTLYVRFSLHSGVGLAAQAREVKHRALWLSAVPAGVLRWLTDRLRIRRGLAR